MSKDRPQYPQQSQPGQPGGERRPAPPVAASATSEAKPKAKPKSESPSDGTWGLFPRIAVSVFVVFHLLAVFTAPWHIQLRGFDEPDLPPGTVPRDLQGRVIAPDRLDRRQYPPIRPVLPEFFGHYLRHYANLLYINNGYDFFSPNPSVSHIIRYEVFNNLGEKVAEGRLPDRRDQRPRLFYHRHMMLVEQSRDPATEGRGWEDAIARELLEKHGGAYIQLKMVRRHLLSPKQVLAGERPDAPAMYEDLGVMEYRPPREPANVSAEQLPGGGR